MPFIQLKQYSIHYEKKGEGKPLVILHGLGNNSQSWRRQLDQLSKTFKVIAWDAPGYGKSSNQEEEFQHFSQFADVLKEFIEGLGFESVYLLGHSMGSAIAIDFTSRFPEKVDALILADPTRGSAGVSPEENKKRLQNRLNSINMLEPAELAKKRVKGLLAPNVDEKIKKEAERIMSQVRPAGYRSVSYSLFNLNQMKVYPTISVPTLIICGELDQVTPVSESEIIHKLVPQSELDIVPSTGHLCYQEDPNTFNKFVKHFLLKQEVDNDI